MSQINALPINGFTIADLALLAPGPGQFLEVGGATEGRIDIDALAAYCLEGLPPTLPPGATGLELMATETPAAALAVIGAESAIEVVSNANGMVIRLPRIGRQICMAASTNNIIANAASGSLFFSPTWLALTFPAEFTTLTSLVVSGRGIPGVATGWVIHAGESTTGFAAYSYATVNGGGCRVSYIAIGDYTP